MTGSKAARVLQRTFVGGSMLAVLSVILWLASRDGGVRVILWSGCVLAALSSLELGRMQLPVPGRWTVVQALAIVGVLALISRGFAQEAQGEGVGTLVWRTSLWALACAAVGVISHRSVFRRERPDGGGVLLALLLFLWVILPLPWVSLVMHAWGLKPLIALLLLSKVGDIAGFYVGSAIGKSRPFPSISPGKTTAGCVGSLVAGVLVGWSFQLLGLLPAGPLGWATGAFVGGLVNLAAQAGDLLESWLKRRAGVKDSGHVFGPAGGVLDMVDSLLLTVPFALVTWPILLG
jgi:CDP-diglyceride synthetase